MNTHRLHITSAWPDRPCPALFVHSGPVAGRPSRRLPYACCRLPADAGRRTRRRLLDRLDALRPQVVVVLDRPAWRRFHHLLRPLPAHGPGLPPPGPATAALQLHWVPALMRFVHVLRPGLAHDSRGN